MPLPETKNVGKLMKFLKKDKPGMPTKKKIAITLNQARKSGANIPLRNELKRRAKKA